MNKNTGIRSAITNGTPVPPPQVRTTPLRGGRPAERQKTDEAARHRPLRLRPRQCRPQGGRCRDLALAHADARGARTSAKSRRPGARMVAVIPSATGTSRAASASALMAGGTSPRQIPTQILPDEWGTGLCARAPSRCKSRATPEHERRPSSARHRGWSSRAHGAAAALRQEGPPGARPTTPTRWR
jgi:hypothetical protein